MSRKISRNQIHVLRGPEAYAVIPTLFEKRDTKLCVLKY